MARVIPAVLVTASCIGILSFAPGAPRAWAQEQAPPSPAPQPPPGAEAPAPQPPPGAEAPPPPAPEPAPPADFVPPELAEFVPATYPAEAQAKGLEAVVTLEILVDETGATKEVKVVGAAGQGFDEAAVAAAQKFKWRPAKAKGKPVKVRITYAYQFTLDDAPSPSDGPAEPPPKAGTGRIEGGVFEKGTRVPLIGAGVAAVASGGESAGETAAETTTDERGRFSLDRLGPGRYQIVVRAADHKPRRFDETVGESEVVEVRYLVEAKDYNPYQSTISAAPDREELERRVIPVEEATKIPGTRGDALRAVESFPGVSRPPLGSGLLVVRGSNPEDTTSYVAGHWVPLIYHFGGITSVINSDLLERIDYVPGNFSSRYGRAVGGVVSVEVRAPRRDRWSGYVDMDIIDAGFLIEGPVGKGSLALAARRSYVDAIFAAVVPDDSGLDFTQAPVYYDFQAMWDTPLAGGRLRMIGFGVDNQLRFAFGDPAEIDPAFRGGASNHTLFHRVHATWKRPLGETTTLTLSAATGYGALDFELGPSLNFSADFFFNSYRAEVSQALGSHVRLIAGTDALLYPFHIEVRGPRPLAEGQVPAPPSAQQQFFADETSVEWTPSAFALAEISPGYGLTIVPGARAEYYLVADAFSFDPRLSVRWQEGENTVRFGVGRYSQNPQLYETQAQFGNPDVNPERAIHVSLGYDRQLTRAVRVESTLYYKKLSDLIVRDDTLVMQPDGSLAPVAYTNAGIGRIYGAELLLRHDTTKNFFGWVSYTLSRSERRDHPDQDLDWRPFQFDQTHIVTVVGSLKLPWRVEAGLRFRYVTGNPDTPIVGSIYDADADVYLPIPGESGSTRIAPYHQLDVRIDRRWVFDRWMLTAYLDVQNAYNRQNPEGTFYSYDYRESSSVTGLPIIPSIGAKGEF
jgi:TonB family protein